MNEEEIKKLIEDLKGSVYETKLKAAFELKDAAGKGVGISIAVPALERKLSGGYSDQRENDVRWVSKWALITHYVDKKESSKIVELLRDQGMEVNKL